MAADVARNFASAIEASTSHIRSSITSIASSTHGHGAIARD
ncbi:MAG TPA: hypothetical protein VHZ95_21455 [Polyangiales bacterium]|jgi:hypothetical protein|nr:hypothetical protein [Polyangiales bacterium]